MGEPASGKSWPNMCLLQKPSQPSLKLISHQWESPDFLVSPCWFPSCSAACWWYRKAAVPKPFSLVTPHRRLGKLLCGKADRQTPSATGSRCPAEMGSMFHTPKVKNALKCLAEIFFFFNNPPFFSIGSRLGWKETSRKHRLAMCSLLVIFLYVLCSTISYLPFSTTFLSRLSCPLFSVHLLFCWQTPCVQGFSFISLSFKGSV